MERFNKFLSRISRELSYDTGIEKFATDIEGNVTAEVRVSSLAGSNPIVLSLSPIGETFNANWNIEGIADNMPVSLVQFSPSPTFFAS